MFNINDDKLVLGNHEFNSRFILGSGKFSLNLIKQVVENANVDIVTLALRRANSKDTESIKMLLYYLILLVLETLRRLLELHVYLKN